jgi:hypothetical protein
MRSVFQGRVAAIFDGTGRLHFCQMTFIVIAGRSSLRACMELEVHCHENPIYVFPETELRVLSPNFHLYVSVSDIPRKSQHIFLQQIGQTDPRII